MVKQRHLCAVHSSCKQQELSILALTRSLWWTYFTILVEHLSVLNSFSTLRVTVWGISRSWKAANCEPGPEAQECGRRVGGTQGWRHLISTCMQSILERVAMCKGPCEQISQGEQETPNAHKHADLERVIAVQPGRFCLRLTKCFHNGKLSALDSLKEL